MLTSWEGHDVAGGAVPVGKGGNVVLNGPPVLSAMDEPVPEGVGNGPYGKVWMTGGRLVTIWVLVLSVPDRGPLLWLKENEAEDPVGTGKVTFVGGDVPVGIGRVTFVGGDVPVGTGSEELYVGIEALGAVESGGYGSEPVPDGKLKVWIIGGYGTGPVLEGNSTVIGEGSETGGMLVVPDRVPSEFEKEKETGEVPVDTGSEELAGGSTPLLGPVESGG